MWECKEWCYIELTLGIWCWPLSQYHLPPPRHQSHRLTPSVKRIIWEETKNPKKRAIVTIISKYIKHFFKNECYWFSQGNNEDIWVVIMNIGFSAILMQLGDLVGTSQNVIVLTKLQLKLFVYVFKILINNYTITYVKYILNITITWQTIWIY